MACKDKHLEYDISEPYLPFIKSLRASLTHTTTSHGIGVLVPPFSESERHMERCLYLRLTSNDRSIIVVLQQSNLYMRGYSRDGGNTYWAFPDSTSMIPQSQNLEFDGNYDSLEGLSRVRRETLTLGYHDLEDAISNLARTEDPDKQQQTSAKALLILCLMIVEAAKFKLISNHISGYWWTPQRIDRQVIVNLVNSWKTYSGAVQNSDTDVPLPGHSPLLSITPFPNDAFIHTIRQAISAFALLINCGSRGPQQKHDIIQSSYARTLVCIEYIKINNIAGENPSNLYGKVVVKDCWGEHTVYDRSRADSESKRSGQCATLTGPTCAVSGADAFTIIASLMDRDGDASPDNQIAQGKITWDPRFQDSCYDKTVEAIIRGQYGNVTVGYSVITNALRATIKVIMIKGDEENPANIYGTIKVIIPLRESSTTVSLLDKCSSEYIHVCHGNSIPLTRSVIPAPVNSDLIIKASLWDYDSGSPDDEIEIAEGSVQIMPMVTNGPAKPMKITGKYGEVEIYISF